MFCGVGWPGGQSSIFHLLLLHMMRTSLECCNIHPQINSADGREQERANFSAALDSIRTTYQVKWLL